jgi:hypothetical protein
MFNAGDIVTRTTSEMDVPSIGMYAGTQYRVVERHADGNISLATLDGGVLAKDNYPYRWSPRFFHLHLSVDAAKETVRHSKKMEMHFYG